MNDYATYLDEDERTRAEIRTSLGVSMLVEAGAGTGKTRALVDRVVALVLNGTPIESIAVITFTEKAAAELKERVRRALEEGLQQAEDTALLQTALDSLGRASISTIHAFCLGLLRSFAPEAGVDPDFEVQDGVLAERRFQERWRSYLEDLGGEPDAVQVVERVLSLGLTTRDIGTLAWELWSRQHLASVLDAEPLNAAPASWLDLETLRAYLAGLPLGSVSEADLLRQAVERVLEIVERLIADPENREALLAAAAPSLGQRLGNRGRQQDWGGAAAIAKVRDTTTAVCEALAAALESLRSEALAALLPYVVRFVREDAAARDREGTLIFDDLIVRVRDLLQANQAACNTLRQRYQALLIDEFQDTDPLQTEIALSFGQPPGGPAIEPGRLFLVGDPKQSIYRFRRADMAIYASMRGRLEVDGGTLPLLALNRRSRRVVVEAVNSIFEQLIGLGSNPAVQPRYQQIHPEREHVLEGPGFAVFGGQQAGAAREVRRREAAQVAMRCAAAVSEGWEVYDRSIESVRPAAYRDIAILVPARTILLPLERSLADLGIPYRVEGGSLIYGTQDVRDIINCLTAIDDPADEVAVVAALRSPAYACSDLDLARFRAGGGRFNYLHPALDGWQGKVADGLRDLRRCHDDRHAHSLAVTVERLVTERSLVEIGVLDQGNRNAFRRARFLVEQARGFEQHGPESLRAFVAWLERRAGTAILDYEGAGLDDDEDAVRILTIHGAKGLEFPIVIAAGIGTPPRLDSQVFGIDRGSNQVAVSIGAKTHSSRFTLGPADDVQAQERQHADAERDRLLYVATTRARDHLLISLFHAERARDSSAQRLINAGILDHCQQLPLLDSGPPLAAAPFAALEVEAPPSLEDFRRSQVSLLTAAKQVTYTSATALGRASDEDEKTERDDMTEPWARGRAGTHVGRAVHAALQSVSWQADDSEIDAIARAQAVAEAVPDRAPDVASLVRKALGSQAAARARAGRALREVPFALSRDNLVLEGFVDLVIDGPDGLEIVDWKTDSVPASEVERRLESYRLQAGLYVAGLEAATGRKVARVTYVFVSAGSEASPGEPAALAQAALARLAPV